MRLRIKFVGIYALVFGSVLSILAVSLATLGRLGHIRDTVAQGERLLVRARRVREMTKDVMIGVFAPSGYAILKDVVYFSPFAAAIRDWQLENEGFQDLFSSFLKDPVLQGLVERGVLGDEYDTAIIMSKKAFARLDGLAEKVEALRKAGLLGEEGVYEKIQTSSDPELVALFDETRQTTYYLANSFESYLNYFVSTLEREAAAVSSDLIRAYIEIGLVTAALATLATLIFASRIVDRLRTVGEAIRRVSVGDFSTPLSFSTKDEFEELAAGFNSYTNALKANLAAMVALTRDAAETALGAERSAPPGPRLGAGEDPVMSAIADAALRDRAASWASGCAVARRNAAGAMELVQSRGAPPAIDGRRLMAILGQAASAPSAKVMDTVLAGPLAAGDRNFGVLAVWSETALYNDLDLIRFSNYLEFASIVADNAAKYAELVELRNAEYLALQSQVQPHFLYNVLGGFAALNRTGDRAALERYIQALKVLLRYAVDHGDEATVDEELGFVESYLRLQGMRFQERLSWSIEANDRARRARMPKLLLQPLVENAVIHGIEEAGIAGTVTVTAELSPDGGTLELEVKDTGAGFRAESIQRGTGLSNVERRLDLARPGSSLILESSPGHGARALIRICETRRCAS